MGNIPPLEDFLKYDNTRQGPDLIHVLHAPTGRVHRTQVPRGTDEKEFHAALVRQGYVDRRPDLWVEIMKAPSHEGRGIHVVTRRGFVVDGKERVVNDSKPVPPGSTLVLP